MALREEGHEAHIDTEMEDELDDNDMDDENDEDKDTDDDDESKMDSDGGNDNILPLLGLEVVVPKEAGTKRKRKNLILTNVAGFKSFAVEDTQTFRRSCRLKKKMKKVIRRDKGDLKKLREQAQF